MGWKDSIAGLKRFAAAPWFPIIVGALSGLNLFTLVLSGPLVILFVSAVLANKERWFWTALCNAVGTVAGCFLMVMLIEQKGTDFVKEAFPTTFQSKWWSWTEQMMQDYGSVGAVPVAAMPIILHPLIFFGKLSGMSNAMLLGSIFVGRVAKYVIMSQMALTAPKFLRFFGASEDTIAEASKEKST
mmetsp:Transcript_13383/g.20318  ORF Transcript_13383/g.20318 Transcript_13383/m.20318 type:complete len:186 (+) Transcript_13383:85-642(+)|eukprot:CAMPEP_0194763022 /NCGR_PEP_ID=MMETSP0323_2-20130528/17704_1 /TAXON_ID=2866 ORGANISM="Crypthecodinium cohnii, Strain Seligo" /NCGR_SAMPLE_ID=MMETSP0323_2 /ASSEMBLY_ACC=CAM_ASM_000346 /LENGTH=185 /DNA_ID=CAMNT_0039686841 /DNA_START=78 /DNA_END=635 /DNA_ORIENTATION=+